MEQMERKAELQQVQIQNNAIHQAIQQATQSANPGMVRRRGKGRNKPGGGGGGEGEKGEGGRQVQIQNNAIHQAIQQATQSANPGMVRMGGEARGGGGRQVELQQVQIQNNGVPVLKQIFRGNSQCFPKVPIADGFYRLLDTWLSATLIEGSLLSIRLFEF